MSITHVLVRRFAAWRGSVIAAALAAVLGALLPVTPAAAQQYGSIEGTVIAQSGEPLAGVAVRLEGEQAGALTDARGRYRLDRVAPGERTLTAHRIGYAAGRRSIAVAPGGAAAVNFVLAEDALELGGIVVSATREARLKAETPASVGVVAGQEIREAMPAHPSEIVGRVAGVWVSATSGEGHQTAIRQPRSTKPMYLFLEDGVPTRSTGFFNHNALYEVNVPQADRIEVLKGPATALYGSDAIGGVVNVETRRASLAPQWEASVEAGSAAWRRLLLSGSTTAGDDGLRADLNLTKSDGFRDDAGYDRWSGTVRWDRYLGRRATLKTVATFSRIDQTDASALSAEDYERGARVNYNPIAARKVDALRLSAALEAPLGDDALLSVTPYVRYNSMDIVPFWMLGYDPVRYTTGHRSLGMLARVRRDLPVWDARVTGGVDLEYSPGGRVEHRITPVREARIYTSYSEGDLIYDYDVAFRGASPYVQLEAAPLERLRLSAGLRYDHVGYDYDNHLDPATTGRWRRPASTEVRYDHLSPKLGLTYALAPELGFFASYRHGFRAPSEGQLFRQGSSETGVGLQSVRADSYEGGVRGEVAGRLSYEASAYRMAITDDILTYLAETEHGVDRLNTNAGATRHEGVELAAGLALGAGVRLDASWTAARHLYREWAPSATQDFSGNRMESAPRTLSNARLGYAPPWLSGAAVALEWVHVGRYFADPANTVEYPGHDLYNLRLNLPVGARLEAVLHLTNLLDARYAEGVSMGVAGAEFSPGRPRSINLGLRYRWQRGGE